MFLLKYNNMITGIKEMPSGYLEDLFHKRSPNNIVRPYVSHGTIQRDDGEIQCNITNNLR